MPSKNSDKRTKVNWLLDLCKDHVKKYVARSEVSSLVQQTHDLENASEERFPCRYQGCDKSYTFHSRRVR